MRPNHLYVQRLAGIFNGKGVGGEACHLVPSSVKVKNAWSYTSTPPICLHGVDRNAFVSLFTLFVDSPIRF